MSETGADGGPADNPRALLGFMVTHPDGRSTVFVRAHTERAARIEGIRALRHMGHPVKIAEFHDVGVERDKWGR